MKQYEEIIGAMEKLKEWITLALNSSNYTADYTVESLKELDRFFDEQSDEEGLVSKNPVLILFAIGVYVGETIISNFGGKWDLGDGKDEKNIKVVVNDENVFFPVVRVMARYQIGRCNSLYAYVDKLRKSKNDVTVNKQKEMSLDDIFELTDKCDFVTKMMERISKKCKNGTKMEKLNVEERTFYLTQTLETEVNSGGFSAFFFNTDGNFGKDVATAFEKIGAYSTVEICKKAVGVFGDDFPTDVDERQMFMENNETEIGKILDECDEEFYEYKEDLNELNYNFVIKNREKFTE